MPCIWDYTLSCKYKKLACTGLKFSKKLDYRKSMKMFTFGYQNLMHNGLLCSTFISERFK